MNDGSEFDPERDDEPLEIDVRSPGERWADSGRAGFGRAQASLQAQPLALAALCWMLGVTVLVCAQIWQALHISSFSSSFGQDPSGGVWIKMIFLSQTGTVLVSVATLAGLAFVMLAGPARARPASWLGIVLAGWTVIAGGLGVLVAIHSYNFPATTLSENRFVFGVASLASVVLGGVVAGSAWSLAMSDREDVAIPSPPDGPEIVELS